MLAAITMSLGAVCIEFARGIGSRTAGRLRAGIYIELIDRELQQISRAQMEKLRTGKQAKTGKG